MTNSSKRSSLFPLGLLCLGTVFALTISPHRNDSAIAISSAEAAEAICTYPQYDTAQKEMVISVLKTKYGDAFKDFDVDHPSLVDLIDLRSGGLSTNTFALSFSKFDRGVKKQRITFLAYFDKCSGKLVRSIEMLPSNTSP